MIKKFKYTYKDKRNIVLNDRVLGLELEGVMCKQYLGWTIVPCTFTIVSCTLYCISENSLILKC